LGAGKPERAEQAVWKAGFYNMIFLGVIGTAFVLFAEVLIEGFTRDVEVVPYGVSCLRTVSLGFLFYAYGMVLCQAFNGAGAVWTPTFINLFCFWLWQLPLAYLFSHLLRRGPGGVFAAMTIAWSTYAVVGAVILLCASDQRRQVCFFSAPANKYRCLLRIS
jgi:Na+-driven multidrug efflux pump